MSMIKCSVSEDPFKNSVAFIAMWSAPQECADNSLPPTPLNYLPPPPARNKISLFLGYLTLRCVST
jgi:hypothetical protein